MSVIGSNILAGASGQGGAYNLTNSLRFRSSASAYLNRTPASAGNRQIFTWSGWVKRGELGNEDMLFSSYPTNGDNNQLRFSNDNKIGIYLEDGVTGLLVTTQVFRDISAWYHIVFAVDTTQATSSNRIKLYVNGSQVTAFDTSTYPSQNYNTGFNNTILHTMGESARLSGRNFDGYMAEVNFIDGQALTPSSFGETSTSTGVWIPKKYTGTYGTNGFYLPFTDNSALTTSSNVGLGKDFSGNGNYWTTNNISITAGTTYDSMTDVPTISALGSNYATLNPLVKSFQGSGIANGNLSMISAAGNWEIALSTMAVSSGKYYCEAIYGATNNMFGVYNPTQKTWDSNQQNANGGTLALFPVWQQVIINGSATGSFGAISVGDNIGMALNLDASTISFYKNGSLIGGGAVNLPSNMIGIPICFALFSAETGTSTHINFGQRPFAYTPPTGFNRLNTFNLPTPTIGATASTQANKYFNAVTYTGNGSTQTITGLGFQPDLIWVKRRDTTASHNLIDAVRGASKIIYSDATTAEITDSNNINAFNSNGWTMGLNTDVNANGGTYVGWSWDANGSGSTNTDGSITSTVSANTSAGFSIVTFTTQSSGTATVGHGLGVAPSMIITKLRTDASNWNVFHSSVGNTGILNLNTTGATITNSQYWNNTSPTSSVFTTGTWYTGSLTAVAYCFAQIAGYSAFGSYTGNGSTDGPFVYTGFRPKYWLIKRTDSSDFWVTDNSVTSPYNLTSKYLLPNTADAEGDTGSNPAGQAMDVLSNGFKLRNTNSGRNASGGTYIYMAFAENPFKYSLAR